MNFITNHDENSWNGTVQERMGAASDAMLAFQYVIPGMPLIYSGQEYGMDKRLKFFEKDSIPKSKGKVWEQMKKLGSIKNNNPALNGGKNAAAYKRIKTNNDSNVYAIERSKMGEKVFYIANLSKNPVELEMTDFNGEYRDLISGETFNFKKGATTTLSGYDYQLLEPVE